ncbi:HET-E1, partial [Symbiodinium natans]
MVSVAVFLAGTMVFFAWIAVTVFKDLDHGNEGFTSLKESMNSMFIAGVSDEFVSVFLKSYTAYRYVGILWLIFLVIAHVLLLSLVLDTL